VGASLKEWKGIKELRLAAKDRLTVQEGGEEKKREIGADWRGLRPEFRNLRWVTSRRDGQTTTKNAAQGN